MEAAQPVVTEAVTPAKHPNALALLAVFNGDKTKLKFYPQPDGTVMAVFWCPGCKETHTYTIGTYMGLGEWGREKGKPVRMDGWRFNCDLDHPTFEPSLKYDKCHLWIKHGVIEYGWDCSHLLKGKDIPMETF